MTILPQLEHDLLEAARRRASTAGESAATVRVRKRFSLQARRLRVPVLAFCTLLVSGTIALAATGVILTGASVRLSDQQNPDVGDGLPVTGASQVLPLRAADPEGGLPWGMRIIHTTRGKLCLQVGRVKDGELGELGVDGAFNDDGRFHPLPPGALPPLTPVGLQPPGDANTNCDLLGQATVAQHIGLDRGAGGVPPNAQLAVGLRRDIYFGVLGPDAVSVTYDDGEGPHTQNVLPESGAYLIVTRTAPGEQVETGSGSLETYGDAVPSAPLIAITYRIDGKLCQRGPVQPPWSKTPSLHTCPQLPAGTPAVQQPELNIPLHAQVITHEGLITGVNVSFTAPYAITDAAHEYVIAVPDCQTASSRGGSLTSLDRNVVKGETIQLQIGDPFVEICGPDMTAIQRHTAMIEAIYRHTDGGGSVVVGSASISQPPGTKPAPSPKPDKAP